MNPHVQITRDEAERAADLLGALATWLDASPPERLVEMLEDARNDSGVFEQLRYGYGHGTVHLGFAAKELSDRLRAILREGRDDAS